MALVPFRVPAAGWLACVLVNIRSAEVDWVEIYPTGATRRPGYVTHPHGLILVFMRRH